MRKIARLHQHWRIRLGGRVPLAAALGATLALVFLLRALSTPAPAAALPFPKVPGLDLGDALGDIGDTIKGVALGPLNFGVKEMAGMITGFLTALADLIIPDSLVTAAGGVLAWVVQVTDWTAGYPSINGLRSTLLWAGWSLMGSGMAFQAIQTTMGSRSGEDFARSVALAVAGMSFYTWGWGVATSIVNDLTSLIIAQPRVADGWDAIFTFAAGGSVLAGGWIVVPILVMGAATLLIGLLAAKAALMLLGAVVFVLGGLVFPAAVWPGEQSLVRVWFGFAAGVFFTPLVWCLIFAVAGVLLADGLNPGAQLAEGSGLLSAMLQSIMLGITAIMALLLALKSSRLIYMAAQGGITSLIASGSSLAMSSPKGSQGNRPQQSAAEVMRQLSQGRGPGAATGSASTGSLRGAISSLGGAYTRGGQAGFAAAAGVTLAQRIKPGGTRAADSTANTDTGPRPGDGSTDTAVPGRSSQETRTGMPDQGATTPPRYTPGQAGPADAAGSNTGSRALYTFEDDDAPSPGRRFVRDRPEPQTGGAATSATRPQSERTSDDARGTPPAPRAAVAQPESRVAKDVPAPTGSAAQTTHGPAANPAGPTGQPTPQPKRRAPREGGGNTAEAPPPRPAERPDAARARSAAADTDSPKQRAPTASPKPAAQRPVDRSAAAPSKDSNATRAPGLEQHGGDTNRTETNQ